MIQQAIHKLTAIEAVAAANLFLSDHMPDRYCAGDAGYDNVAQAWRVPVVMSYLHIGEIGEVGEITVSGFSEKIISHTPFDEMRIKGRSLYEQNREAIEATLMTTATVSRITAFEAEAAAGGFLTENLPDRLTTGTPHFDHQARMWRVPVLLSYPRIGPVGQAGEICVSDSSDEIVTCTPADEILKNANALYEQHLEAIEAIVL